MAPALLLTKFYAKFSLGAAYIIKRCLRTTTLILTVRVRVFCQNSGQSVSKSGQMSASYSFCNKPGRFWVLENKKADKSPVYKVHLSASFIYTPTLPAAAAANLPPTCPPTCPPRKKLQKKLLTISPQLV